MNTILKKTMLAIVILSTVLASTPALAQSVTYIGYNVAPLWDDIPASTVVQGNTLSLFVRAEDNNGDALTYAALRLPDNASFNPVTRVFSFTPKYDQVGTFPVVLSVTDGRSVPVSKTFYVTAITNVNRMIQTSYDPDNAINDEPYFSSTRSYYAVNSGQRLDFTVRAIDPEGSSVFYNANNLPTNASFDQERGIFVWTPTTAQRGVYTLQFYATDGFLTSAPLMVTIVVDGGQARRVVTDNRSYALSGSNVYSAGVYNIYGYNATTGIAGQPYFTTTAPTTVRAGASYVYDAMALDPNNDQVRYQLVSSPSGAYINQNSGRVSWVAPANSYTGQTYQFVILADDGRSEPARQQFTVTVTGGTSSATSVYYPSAAPAVKYVYRDVPTTQTVVAPVTTPTTLAYNTSYYPANTVVINAGRTVGTYAMQASYGADIYGVVSAQSLRAFNVAVRVDERGEMIVSWDTSSPTKPEVVYGYSSHPRSDAWNTILNYDFTTGQLDAIGTKHQVSLGKLQIGRTYYLRAISRNGQETDISREIIFIPMVDAQNGISVKQYDGAASASATVGSLFSATTFIVLLALIAGGLLLYGLYLMFVGARKEASVPELHLNVDHGHESAAHTEPAHH